MRSSFRVSHLWMLGLVLRILGLLVVLNLMVLLILWLLKILYLFAVVLAYEGFFVAFLGVLQILGSYIYREDSIPYRGGFRTGWFDFRKFAKSKPEERKRFRQEGIIMIVIGLTLLVGLAIVHFYFLAYS
jgi:hypothetical protein